MAAMSFAQIVVRRLRAGLDFDAIPDASRESGFRFDVSVLDEPGFVLGLDANVCRAQGVVHIAAHHAPADKNVVRPGCVCSGQRAGLQRLFTAA